ncbi:MAG: VanW family protein, partial [Oscillospiraceae bacterium]|nr:VanW family protein [Oscillospiraceae bacterium]
MLDPKDKTLQPPVRRSWLRLRLGKAYYAGKRYLLWCSARFRWAKERQGERLPCIQSAHATPLLRHLRGDQMEWQRNKVVNLKLAVARLDGLILHPGETFSYWKLI